MMRVVLAGCLLLLAPLAGAVVPPDLIDGFGEPPNGHLSMLFEVTFMSIDVATVDAYLSPQDATEVGKVLLGEEKEKEQRKAIERYLRASENPVVVSMTFKRDSGWDKFLKGVRGGLERAAEEGLISEAEYQEMWPPLEEKFASVAERGVLKGDAVYYHIDGATVRTVYFGVEGDVLLDFTETSNPRAVGTRASYFGMKSKFREKLVKSLFDSD